MLIFDAIVLRSQLHANATGHYRDGTETPHQADPVVAVDIINTAGLDNP